MHIPWDKFEDLTPKEIETILMYLQSEDTHEESKWKDMSLGR